MSAWRAPFVRRSRAAAAGDRDRTRDHDRAAIHHHYDLSNDFYALFLDPLLVYSCAYYRDPQGTLAQAQRDKLELVCRKLDLAPGERFLDVGCGWGSLSLWAARHHGVQATGLTLAAEQASYAAQWAAREGLGDHCRIVHGDWRDLEDAGGFDKIAAVGILEHVGVARLPDFFSRLLRLLRPGGRLLNHGISRRRHWKHTPQWDFLTRHVFPNGDLIHVSHVASVLEDVGFELEDQENLRLHYARTCRHWVERLQAREADAIALVGRERYRTWLLYLASSAVAFEDGWIGLHQIVATRPAGALADRPPLGAPDARMQPDRPPKSGGAPPAPRTREQIYRDFPAIEAGSDGLGAAPDLTPAARVVRAATAR